MTPDADAARQEHVKARETQIANDLASWIDEYPLPPSAIHPVYDAHVLLCSLIEREAAAESSLTALRQERDAARAALRVEIELASLLRQQLEALQGQIEALRPYADHKSDCELVRNTTRGQRNVRQWNGPVDGWRVTRCTCGLSTLLASLGGK